jgi:hypothetical protein
MEELGRKEAKEAIALGASLVSVVVAPRVNDEVGHPPFPVIVQHATADEQASETPDSESLLWSEIAYHDQTFVLKRELPIRVVQENGVWSFESKDYGLLGFGHTRDEAELAFRSDFSFCWNEIACEDDSKLARRAKEIKQTFLNLVCNVK